MGCDVAGEGVRGGALVRVQRRIPLPVGGCRVERADRHRGQLGTAGPGPRDRGDWCDGAQDDRHHGFQDPRLRRYDAGFGACSLGCQRLTSSRGDSRQAASVPSSRAESDDEDCRVGRCGRARQEARGRPVPRGRLPLSAALRVGPPNAAARPDAMCPLIGLARGLRGLRICAGRRETYPSRPTS